ncbi:MAG: hypothetical protein LBC61_00575 [Candidatus Peribacteria bacterium]|jgi:hypothetical protein|nr:hypothetical protein [Candidatus Peribacteria bacterium]
MSLFLKIDKMKKIFNAMLLLVMILSLSSCFWQNDEDDIKNVKDELLNSGT